jgi:hypothetical protein
MSSLLRRLVPRSVKHRISAQLARGESAGLHRQLADLAAGDGPIVVGPWLGEVGFELLYWVPFVAWFAERYAVDPSRLLVLSRGGTGSWYAASAGNYRDVLDFITPETYKARHEARVRDIGEQKQTRITPFERELVATMSAEAGAAGAPLLHPETMYRVLRPFWWGHLDESWVHRHALYRRLPIPDGAPPLPESYVAVKFYFNDCFPASERNRAFVRQVVSELAQEHAIVSLSTGVDLDDHGCYDIGTGALDPAAATPPSRNLHLQSAIVARATAFVGTYGGFAYLAPFYGVKSVAYYDNPDGFSTSHLRMARSALARLATPDLLQARPAHGELVTR